MEEAAFSEISYQKVSQCKSKYVVSNIFFVTWIRLESFSHTPYLGRSGLVQYLSVSSLILYRSEEFPLPLSLSLIYLLYYYNIIYLLYYLLYYLL